jgi:DNA-binding response OmpR family regulator
MKALVVDDDISIQTMIDALLTRHGVDVDPAFNGTEALIRLRNRTYDAIVLDLLLPKTNGFETVRHLHIVDPGLLQRVIVMTAASERTLQLFDKTAVPCVLRKPVDINELITEVLACGH